MENEQAGLPSNNKPIRIPKNKNRQCMYDRLLEGTYKKDEIIVFLPHLGGPKDEDIKTIKNFYRQFGYLPEDISVRKCDDCDIPIFLLKGKNIHTVINTEGVTAGSAGATSTVGEKYGLNFYNYSPFDKEVLPSPVPAKYTRKPDTKPIIVAVLDTGINTELVDKRYLWNGRSDKDSTCYKNGAIGWNFIEDNDKYKDDNADCHGSVVSQYIINGFKHSQKNHVEIMPLKTHDKDGVGDLFGIICAIHFAISKGANIINASWGFYYYDDFPLPYLETLITTTLKKNGILFVTAAGNQILEEDIIARRFFLMEYPFPPSKEQLRDLLFHYFYPARLSLKQGNVVTVTTTNESIASPTQNYSDVYADLAVLADLVSYKDMSMSFYAPYSISEKPKRGSSFAAAIATGIIGACCDLATIQGGDKTAIFEILSEIDAPVRNEKILSFNDALAKRFIKDGALIKNWGKI